MASTDPFVRCVWPKCDQRGQPSLCPGHAQIVPAALQADLERSITTRGGDHLLYRKTLAAIAEIAAAQPA
jgi:hypothetical protein